MKKLILIIWFIFKDLLGLFNNVKDGYITIEKAEENQKKLKSDVNEITKGEPKNNS